VKAGGMLAFMFGLFFVPEDGGDMSHQKQVASCLHTVFFFLISFISDVGNMLLGIGG
jgi:hypothetical protein